MINNLAEHMYRRIQEETANIYAERDTNLAIDIDEGAHRRAPQIGQVRFVAPRRRGDPADLEEAIEQYRLAHPDHDVTDTGVVRDRFALEAERAYFGAERAKLHAAAAGSIGKLNRDNSRFQLKEIEAATTYNNTIAQQLQTWQSGLAGAKGAFAKCCNKRVLEKVRDDINADRVRRAFWKITQMFTRIGEASHDEKMSAMLAIENYKYTASYTLDDNIAYFEKILARHRRLYGEAAAYTEKDYSKAFLKAVSYGDAHGEIKGLARDYYSQCKIARGPGAQVTAWPVITQSFRVKYQELLDTGKIKVKTVGTTSKKPYMRHVEFYMFYVHMQKTTRWCRILHAGSTMYKSTYLMQNSTQHETNVKSYYMYNST